MIELIREVWKLVALTLAVVCYILYTVGTLTFEPAVLTIALMACNISLLSE